MLSQPKDYRRQCHHCQVIALSLFIAGRDATPLLEAQNAALHDIAPCIICRDKHDRTTAKRTFFLPLLTLVAPLRDQMLDTAPAKRLAATRITIALVRT